MQKQYNGPRTMHMVMNLDFALDAALCKRSHPWHTGHLHSGAPNVKIRKVLGLEHLSFNEIIKELQAFKAKGFKVIPGEGCNHNPDGTCPGHVKRGIASGSLHA